MRDGIPRRLTFRQVDDGYVLKKCLNVKGMQIGRVYSTMELNEYYDDELIDVVIK